MLQSPASGHKRHLLKFYMYKNRKHSNHLRRFITCSEVLNTALCLAFRRHGDIRVQGGEVEFDGHKFQKWLPKPLSFFMWDTEGDCLQALAVEVARGGRVFTPADRKKRGLLGRIPLLGGTSDDWLFAKICVGEQTASLYRSFRSQMLGYLLYSAVLASRATELSIRPHETHTLRGTKIETLTVFT